MRSNHSGLTSSPAIMQHIIMHRNVPCVTTSNVPSGHATRYSSALRARFLRSKKFSSSECFTLAFVQFSSKKRIISSTSGVSLPLPRTIAGRRISRNSGSTTMGHPFLSAMHRPVSAARAISLVITRSTGIHSKRCAANSAWRLPSSESGVFKYWYARFSLPSVDPCRTKYTVFIAALWFAPNSHAGLSMIERRRLSDGDRDPRYTYILRDSLRDGTCQLFDKSVSKWMPNAALQARGAAAARHERRLFPVACKRWLGPHRHQSLPIASVPLWRQQLRPFEVHLLIGGRKG